MCLQTCLAVKELARRCGQVRLRPIVKRHGLRGADAVHLASALWQGSTDFACYDSRLAEAAAAEGLTLAT